MKFARRILLFVIVNVLIVATLSVVLNLLGVGSYIAANRLNFQSLIGFCLVWGFGAAGISLALSRITAKWMMRVKVIDQNSASGPLERELVMRVHRHAQAVGLTTMPEVGLYDSPDPNAFATGPSKNRSLVAVSTGLVASMDRDEVDAVLAHEVAHIANGDMVTMTLIQGVVNAFGMFLARVAGWALGQTVRDELRPAITIATTIAFDIVFALAGALLVARFSRQREFRADHGAANLVGPRKMIAALETLRRHAEMPRESVTPAIAALQISGKQKGFVRLLASHPPLEDRIAALRNTVVSPRSKVA